jgi:hypothetical protein
MKNQRKKRIGFIGLFLVLIVSLLIGWGFAVR